ncbi:MAG: intracellular sulfur oxidation DsrE/DsrF family protein [Halieaceae bacterium]|jgi:intracellular sulfur oxidation DsrE/DsrF family protein
MRFILLNLAKPGLIVSASVVWLLVVSLLASPILADGNPAADQHYLAEFELHTAQEMQGVLLRAEQLMIDGAIPLDGEPRVAFVLHGPEVRILLRENYLQNKAVVDKAAALSALGVVEIKACRTWMGSDEIDPADLQFFVETVPYGPAESARLLEQESYISF